MHKILKNFFIFPLLALSLSSCASKEVSIDKYFIDVEVGDKLSSGYRILQLTDIHLNVASNLNEDKNYLNKLISLANPDYIVLTGDTFLNATIHEIEFAYSYFDSWNIPWSIVWGNHDKEGTFSSRELINSLNNRKNLKFIDHLYDNVYGDSNYCINIKSEGETKWRFVMLDSNSYHNDISTPKLSYDSLHDDQVKWYENIIQYENTTNIPSLIFMHIPTHEYKEAIDKGYEYTGDIGEGICHGYRNSGIVDSCKKLESTKGIFVGHDHFNNFAVNYDGIVLSYGVKTGINCFHNYKIGGQIITISDSGDFSLNSIERIFVDYE